MTGTCPTFRDPRISPADRHDDGVEVDVWSARVDRPADPAGDFALLDDAERARAGRFRSRRDRDRFVARRAFMRSVLADHLGVDPSDVVLRTGRHGKPDLDMPMVLGFNASHSDGLAVVAVTSGRRVGVDIERLRPIDSVMDLAGDHCTEREIALLRSAPEADRTEVFLTLWTRKEATVKALGGGLSIPLDSFDASEIDDHGIGRPHGPALDRPLAFIGLEGLAGYAGAVTVEGSSVTLRVRTLGAAAA